MKAKVIKLADKQHKVSVIDDDSEWVIICAQCENDTFEIVSNQNPECDDAWEVSSMVCAKCGTEIYYDEDE